MPPEYNSSDSFFTKSPVLFGGIIALILLTIPAIWLYNEIKPTQVSENTKAEIQPVEQVEEEGIIQQQNNELDKLRQEAQAEAGSQPIATTTTQSQIKSLDTLRSQSIKQTNTEAPSTPKTLEQQIKELDALRAQTQ